MSPIRRIRGATRPSVGLMVVACALSRALALAAPPSQPPQHVRYSLEVLGTLGGTFSETHGLNDQGSAAGQSSFETGSDFPVHAFFWQKGVMTDIGTFGGPDSLVPIGNHSLSERDAVIGFSETSTSDPNGDDFCMQGNGLVCLPFVWESGALTALPTLGGNNGNAFGINNRGQIVGQAETPNLDPCSPFAQATKPVIWRHGLVEEVLSPFGGTAAVGFAINDNGEVVGLSGCNPTFSLYCGSTVRR